jgi:putative colanic acid biosynthesis acetyltransferase WcaF
MGMSMDDEKDIPPTYIDLSRFTMPASFRGKPAWFVQLWWLVQDWLIHPSPQFMYGWRRFWWRAFGAQVGQKVLIRPSARVTFPWKVRVGDYAWIGDRAELYSLAPITIGKNAVISQDTTLCAGSHDYTKIGFPLIAHPIVVEDEVWVAAGSFVAQGVTIGKGAVIGAKSVVLESMPASMICVGHPAKPLKPRPVPSVE